LSFVAISAHSSVEYTDVKFNEGGSEGTTLSTHIATHHPEVVDVVLASSMVENFSQLYTPQMYEILPSQMISMIDKDGDGLLSGDDHLFTEG
jgi:hypothetical protein